MTTSIVKSLNLTAHRAALEAQRKQGARKKKVCFTVDDQVTPLFMARELEKMKVKVFDLNINQVCLLGLEGILRNGEYVGHLRRGDHAHYLDT